MASENDSQSAQIESGGKERVAPYSPCPTCGGYVEEDSIWLRYNKFYCSEVCGKKAKNSDHPDERDLLHDWVRAIEGRQA